MIVNMSKRSFIKKQNGFVVSDAILAILILIMFTGLITSLIYNIIVTSKKIKINSQQVTYITDVFNYAERLAYNDVTTENLIKYVNEKNETKNSLTAGIENSNLQTPYKMIIKVEKYNETEGNTEKEDLIKIITLKVETELSKKTYTTQMKMLKKVNSEELNEKI